MPLNTPIRESGIYLNISHVLQKVEKGRNTRIEPCWSGITAQSSFLFIHKANSLSELAHPYPGPYTFKILREGSTLTYWPVC